MSAIKGSKMNCLFVFISICLGYCVGSFAMFWLVRELQMNYTSITNDDVHKNTRDVFMEQVEKRNRSS